MTQVESMSDKISRQPVEQFRVRSRVRRAKIIRRIHDAPSHELSPYPVDGRAREVWVRGRGQPFGQPHAPVLAGTKGLPLSAQELGPYGLLGVRVLELQIGIDVKIALVVARAALVLHLREECCQPHEIFAPPLLAGVIVAAGALQADTQEDLA